MSSGELSCMVLSEDLISKDSRVFVRIARVSLGQEPMPKDIFTSLYGLLGFNSNFRVLELLMKNGLVKRLSASFNVQVISTLPPDWFFMLILRKGLHCAKQQAASKRTMLGFMAYDCPLSGPE